MENLKLGSYLTGARYTIYPLVKPYFDTEDNAGLIDWCDEFMDANQSITALCALSCVLSSEIERAETEERVDELCEIHSYVIQRAKRILGPSRWERFCNKPFVEPRENLSSEEKFEKLFDKIMATQAA